MSPWIPFSPLLFPEGVILSPGPGARCLDHGPTGQRCGLAPSGHAQKATNACRHKWNNKAMLLSLSQLNQETFLEGVTEKQQCSVNEWLGPFTTLQLEYFCVSFPPHKASFNPAKSHITECWAFSAPSPHTPGSDNPLFKGLLGRPFGWANTAQSAPRQHRRPNCTGIP